MQVYQTTAPMTTSRPARPKVTRQTVTDLVVMFLRGREEGFITAKQAQWLKDVILKTDGKGYIAFPEFVCMPDPSKTWQVEFRRNGAAYIKPSPYNNPNWEDGVAK